MIAEHPTLVPMRPAHQVAHVQLLGAGWDECAVVGCDTAAGHHLPI